MSISEDQNILATSGEDGNVIIWNINNREKLYTLKHEHGV